MNQRFFDVDFTRDPRYVAGTLPLPDRRPRCRHYGDEATVYPESQWRELVAELEAAGGGSSQLVTRIYDQEQEGSCVANATGQSHEIVQAKQLGRDRVVPLSAISLYKRIGRSASSGAIVSDGLEEMVERGILPLDTAANRQRFAHVMPNTGFRTPFPDGWEETARLFRAVEFLEITKFTELVSALINQHPVVVGRSGHSICYCDPLYREGQLVVKYANSWSQNWGEGGFGYDSARMIRSASQWAFAVRSVIVPDDQGVRA